MRSIRLMIFGLGITLIPAFIQCKKDSEEALYPPPKNDGNGDNSTDPCDTATVSYKNFVVPLLQNAGCIGCHGDVNPSAGIALNGIDNVRRYVQNGSLLGSIRHDAGFKAMPPTGQKLPDCDIRKLEAWVSQGTENN